jgi:hypothetical protein
MSIHTGQSLGKNIRQDNVGSLGNVMGFKHTFLSLHDTFPGLATSVSDHGYQNDNRVSKTLLFACFYPSSNTMNAYISRCHPTHGIQICSRATQANRMCKAWIMKFMQPHYVAHVLCAVHALLQNFRRVWLVASSACRLSCLARQYVRVPRDSRNTIALPQR